MILMEKRATETADRVAIMETRNFRMSSTTIST
jgi:hypothetical protein